MAVCFRIDPSVPSTGVAVEAGALYGNRNSAAALLTPLFLTTADHSTALQPLPNQ
jgi:hypothetical protein